MLNLIQQVHQWHQAKKEIIIYMDANEPVNNPKVAIYHLFQETDLLDLYHHKYPGNCKPTTQQWEWHAIVLIVGSPCIAAALAQAWIYPFGHPASIKGNASLHAGSWSWPRYTVWWCNHSNYAPGDLGYEEPSCPKSDQILQCNWHQLAKQLAHLQTLPMLDAHHITELKDIDAQLTKHFLTADQMCSLPQPDPWSLELNEAYLHHCLWSIVLSAHHNQQNTSDILVLIHACLLPSPKDAEEPFYQSQPILQGA